jgi:hypothetical protein
LPIPTLITELSQTAASNYPAGSDSPATLDDTQRAHASFIAQLRDGKGFTNPVVLASATTTDIGGQNSQFVEISGTTTITSLGSTYNGPRFLRFQGVLTLTYNATSLILPGAASITTAAGDTAFVAPNQALNGWTVYSYQRAAGTYASAGPLASSGITGAAASGANNDITSLTALASVPTIVSSNVVNLTGNQTVAGIKTFSSQPVMPLQSMVRLTTTGIANGSTNTAIGRFSTSVTNQGSDITYADSVTLGATFTINANGVYAVSYTAGANGTFGLSLNSTQLSTSIVSITTADRLTQAIAAAAGYYQNSSWTGYLTAGAVVRPHTDATALGANSTITIVRVA